MTVKDKNTLKTDINNIYADNVSGDITAAILRNQQIDIVDSVLVSSMKPAWITVPDPDDAGFGIGFSFDVSSYVTGAVSYALNNGPSWASIASDTGIISGVPDAVAATTGITVTATNTNGDTTSNTFTITVVAIAPVWDNNIASVNWAIGVAPNYDYSAHIANDGGDSDITYAATGLPAGMDINTSTGITTGDPDADSQGLYSIALTATNSGGTSPQGHSIVVPPDPIEAPTWSTIPPQDWIVGNVIAFDLSLYISNNGGAAISTWGDGSGTDTVPGLSVNASTGLLEGTISSAVGSPYTMLYNADNGTENADSGSHTVAVSAAPATTQLLFDNPIQANGNYLFDDPATDYTSVVEFDSATDSITEGGTLTVTLNRSGSLTGALNQNIVVPNGTTYFNDADIAANFADTESTIDVDIVLKTAVAGDQLGEVVPLTLSANNKTGGTNIMNVTVSDSEAASTVSFSSATYSTVEGQDISLTLNRSGSTTGALNQNVVVPPSLYVTPGDYPANFDDGESQIFVAIGTNLLTGDQGGETIPLQIDGLNGSGITTTNVTISDATPTADIKLMNFEGGTLGQTVDTHESGAHFAWPLTVFSDESPHSGTQCCKATLTAGSGGNNEWGIWWNFGDSNQPTQNIGFIYEGEEIWFRTWVRWPVVYNPTHYPKGFRLLYDAGGSIDLYPFDDGIRTQIWINFAPGTTEGTWCYNWDGTKTPPWPGTTNPDICDIDNAPKPSTGWECWEVNVKVSSTLGNGHYRWWRNDTLVFEDTYSRTLGDGGTHVLGCYLFTLFSNNGSPVTQSTYCDDVAFTKTTPPGRDANNNPFIGKDWTKATSP